MGLLYSGTGRPNFGEPPPVLLRVGEPTAGAEVPAGSLDAGEDRRDPGNVDRPPPPKPSSPMDPADGRVRCSDS